MDPLDCIVDELVHDGLGGLLLVDDGGALAHEVRAVLLEGVLVVILLLAAGGDRGLLIVGAHELVQVGLVGDDALGGEVLDLLGAVDLPVVDVVVVTDAHGATGEDDGADVVVVARRADGVLVSLGGAGLIGQDEAGAHPDGAGSHHEGGGQELTVVDAAGSDDLDGATGDGRLVLAALLDDGGDEDGGGDVAGVAAALTTLGADDVDVEIKALLDVLDVADHVHVDDAVLVQPVDDLLGGDTDGGDEQLGAGLNDDVDELVQLALGVIVAKGDNLSAWALMQAVQPTAGGRLGRELARQDPILLSKRTLSCERYRQPGGEADRHRRARSCHRDSS